jgi:hypothetical protein
VLYTAKNHNEVRDAALQLARANVPFSFIVRDVDGVSPGQRKPTTSTYDYVIVGKNSTPEEREAIQKETRAQVLEWKKLTDLPEAITRQVVVDGSDQVRVSLRSKPGNTKTPLICQVMNQNYDLEKDAIQPAAIRVSIDQKLVEPITRKTPFRRAIAHFPDRESMPISIAQTGDRLSFSIEKLGLWAIVEFDTE